MRSFGFFDDKQSGRLRAVVSRNAPLKQQPKTRSRKRPLFI